MEGNAFPSFFTDDHRAFPPLSGFNHIRESMKECSDQIANLQDIVNNLAQYRNQEEDIVNNTISIKEEIIEIKEYLNQMKSRILSPSRTQQEARDEDDTQSESFLSPLQIPAAGRVDENRREDPDRSYQEALSGLAEQRNRNNKNQSRSPKHENTRRQSSETYASKLKQQSKPSPPPHNKNHDKRTTSSSGLQNQNKRKEGILGNRKNDTSLFKASRKTYDLFIGRVHLDVSGNSIQKYMNNVLKVKPICISLIESIHKYKHFNSFKVTVDADIRDSLLDPDLWPENVVVNKFFSRKQHNYRYYN